MEYLAQHIESLIFTCEQPISFKEIKQALDETFETTLPEEEVKETIQALTDRYESEQSSFEIVKIAGGYQFLTKGAFHNTVGTYLKQTIKKRLSRAALETLAIIAYKQPVTKGDIENIRGVNCDYAAQKLLEKELITITGRKDAPGRPLLYGTSQKFMDYFGIEDLQELPKLKEFQAPDNSIGEAAPIEEEVTGVDGIVHKEDDIVDVAIAVADIYDPIPPREDEDPGPDGNDENDGNDGNGTPVADLVDHVSEEGAIIETVELPEDLAEDAEEQAEPVSSEEPPMENEEDQPDMESQEEELPQNEAATDTSVAEFVQKTSGEFTAESLEADLPEEELAAEGDNQIAPDDVTPEEEISPFNEE